MSQHQTLILWLQQENLQHFQNHRRLHCSHSHQYCPAIVAETCQEEASGDFFLASACTIPSPTNPFFETEKILCCTTDFALSMASCFLFQVEWCLCFPAPLVQIGVGT
jgi:hypothetical protein